MSDERSFDGRIALVTGASRGLGRALAQALGARGAQVIALARTVGGLEELDDAIQSAGGPKALLVPMDLSQREAIAQLGPALFERYGRLDLWIHAAAEGASLTPTAQLDDKTLDKLMAVNALAVSSLIATLDPLLRAAERGQAAFLIDRKAGQAYWGAYGASKAAGEALARSYAAEARAGAHPVAALLHEPPAMPTALRARTHPGEDRAALTACEDAAAALLALLAAG